jgi:hypothetical protein
MVILRYLSERVVRVGLYVTFVELRSSKKADGLNRGLLLKLLFDQFHFINKNTQYDIKAGGGIKYGGCLFYLYITRTNNN